MATAALALSAVAPSAAHADASGPGCDSSRPAVAHYAGGAPLKAPPRGAPVPCGMATGFAGGESAIAVTNGGAVLYAPAVQALAGAQTQYFLGGNSGFARSTDLGKTWSFDNPVATPLGSEPAGPLGTPGYPAWDQIDDKFFMDRDTGRLFWADPDLPSEAVVWSDDDGRTWGLSELPVGFGGEWTQVTTAKPRTSKTNGYPKVVYACGEYDSIARDVSTKLEGDLCQKSLDGGQTWITAGQALFGAPVGTHGECAGQEEHPNFSPWAAPDSHGRLFELLFCAGHTFLIRSDDEGATWQVAARVPYDLANDGPGGTGSAELRSDSADNLYLAWAAAGNPNPNSGYKAGRVVMAISRDFGKTWTQPIDVIAPGVEGIRTHFGFDVGVPGHVAISYLGHAPPRAGFDGYVTETYDALDSRPQFWSGVVNTPAQAPLDSGGKGSSNGLGLDYVSAAIGPDGTPWASFWDACGEDLPQRDPGCPPSRNPEVTTFGFMNYAGRLAGGPVTAQAGCVDARRFRFKLHHARRARVVKVVVDVDGRRVLTRRGRSIPSVTLKRLPLRVFHVKVVSIQSSGSRLVSMRTYRGCVKTRPRTRGRHAHRPRRR